MNSGKRFEDKKYCAWCDSELPIEMFSKDKTQKDGHQRYCKKCHNIRNEQWYLKNREHALKRRKEHHELHLDKVKENYINNKEQILEDRKKYREKNREKICKHLRNYYKENKEKYFNYSEIRRAKKHKLSHTLTKVQWEQIKKDFNYSCAYCGMAEEEHLEKFRQHLHQEHFIALSNSGEYTHNNIIPACMSCNASKFNKDFFEWYSKQEFYSKEREKKIIKYLNYTDDGKQQLKIAL